MDEQIEEIKKRLAASGKVSYGDPTILHDTSKSRVVFIPFFIPHSDRTELACRIETYLKQKPPLGWKLTEEKSISLQEEATKKLLAVLRNHLFVARVGDDGDYLVIKKTGNTPLDVVHDPIVVAAALTNALSQPDIVEHLKNIEMSLELTTALRGAIKLTEMKNAVAKLRELLNSGENNEEIYRQWCKTHSWAFGNAYVMPDDVRDISTGDQLDLLLPSVIAGFRDIVELKSPGMSVLNYDNGHKNYYFMADTSKAIGQCHRYLDVLQEEAAKGLRDHPEIVAYHPRAIIVIGRSNDWEVDKLRALHGLNHRLSGITIITYDHLLEQGERLIEMLQPMIDEPVIEPVWDDDIQDEVLLEDEIPDEEILEDESPDEELLEDYSPDEEVPESDSLDDDITF